MRELDTLGPRPQARWVLAHRRPVAGSWLAVTIPAFVGLGPAVDALTSEFTVPAQTKFKISKQTERKSSRAGKENLPCGIGRGNTVNIGAIDRSRRRRQDP